MDVASRVTRTAASLKTPVIKQTKRKFLMKFPGGFRAAARHWCIWASGLSLIQRKPAAYSATGFPSKKITVLFARAALASLLTTLTATAIVLIVLVALAALLTALLLLLTGLLARLLLILSTGVLLALITILVVRHLRFL